MNPAACRAFAAFCVADRRDDRTVAWLQVVADGFTAVHADRKAFTAAAIITAAGLTARATEASARVKGPCAQHRKTRRRGRQPPCTCHCRSRRRSLSCARLGLVSRGALLARSSRGGALQPSNDVRIPSLASRPPPQWGSVPCVGWLVGGPVAVTGGECALRVLRVPVVRTPSTMLRLAAGSVRRCRRLGREGPSKRPQPNRSSN
jgi:hypothetical protein